MIIARASYLPLTTTYTGLERDRGKVARQREREIGVEEKVNHVSSPSSFTDLEVIEELDFKEQDFLAVANLPPIFVDY